MQFQQWFIVPGLVLACALPAMAQQTVGDASASGRVVDASGAVVVGADVTVRHQQTGVSNATVTSEDGRFRFPILRVGPYELTVARAGFTPASRPLSLTVGSAFEIPIVLTVEGVTADVIVTADAPILEAARSQVAATMSEAEVRQLPLNGRNFLDIALLAPTVAPPNINSTQLFAETSAVAGVGLSVGSQRNLSNSFVVDGLSANDDAAGLSGMTYGVDAVEQFQVVTSGGQAELGRALGGYVNVVTRSGTNARAGHGVRLLPRRSLQRRQRPLRHDAADVAAAVRRQPRRTRSRATGRSTSPTSKQRLLDQTGLTTITPANAAIINARLAAVGYPGAPVTTGIYDSPVETLHAPRQGRSRRQRARSTQRALQPLRRRGEERTRCGRTRRRPRPRRGSTIATRPCPSPTRSRSATVR